MIRSYFGLKDNPFTLDKAALLPHQQEVFEALRVHCQQGGLCVIVGEPGTGKSVIKHALCRYDEQKLITPVVNRTLHTYHSTLRILCECVTKLQLTSGCRSGDDPGRSLVSGNTERSLYRVLRLAPRGVGRSVDRECAGRNAKA